MLAWWLRYCGVAAPPRPHSLSPLTPSLSHHPIKLTTTRHELVKMLSAAKRPLTLRMMRLSAVRRTFAVEFSGGEELGFTIGEQAGWYVSALAPGSPAAKQGAVVGDEVVGINGTQIPAAPTKAELIRRIVNAHEKEGPFTLDLMRMRVETEKHTRRFEGTVLGATIANAPHGFVVAALAEGGAAAELGVAPGDVLVSINGEKVGQGAAAEESRSKKDKKKKKAVSKPGGLVPLSTCADVVGYIVAELAADTDLDIEFERRVPCPEPGGAAGEAEDAASQEGPADGGLAASSADPVEAAQARAAACATQVEASSQKVNAAATSGGPAALIVAVNAHKALMEEKRFADAAVTRAKRVAAGETPVSSFAATRAASLRSTSSGACTPKQVRCCRPYYRPAHPHPPPGRAADPALPRGRRRGARVGGDGGGATAVEPDPREAAAGRPVSQRPAYRSPRELLARHPAPAGLRRPGSAAAGVAGRRAAHHAHARRRRRCGGGTRDAA